jgi:hypothetical protein
MTVRAAPSPVHIIPVAPPYVLVRARHGWILANPNDFYLGRAIVEYGEYGEIESQFVGQLFIRPGAVVEVGANSGTHTVALAARAQQQRRADSLSSRNHFCSRTCAPISR